MADVTLDGRPEDSYGLQCGSAWVVRSEYEAARDAGMLDGSDANIWIGQGELDPGSSYTIVRRGFVSFNIPVDAVNITSAALILGGYGTPESYFNLYVLESNFTSVENDAFSTFDGYVTGAPFTGTILNDDWNTSEYTPDDNIINLNAAAISLMIPSRVIKFAIISDGDYNYIEPSTNDTVRFTNPRLYLDYITETEDSDGMTHTDRKIVLLRVRSLVDELLLINDRAAQLESNLAGLGDADAADTINKLLSAGGNATTTDGSGDTISDEIVGILYGNVTVEVYGTAYALDWSHSS